MRFAEVFLRLGCALVAWMVVYAHFLWLAVLGKVGCGPDSGDDVHLLLLGMAPLTILFASLLRATRPLGDVHRMLRWLSVPLVPLAPFVVMSIWSAAARVAFGNTAFCSSDASGTWQIWWVPVQIVTLGITVWLLVRVWLDAKAATNP